MMVFSYLISALVGFLLFSSTIGMFELLSSFPSMTCKMSTPPRKTIVFNRTIAGEFSWLHSFPRSAEKMYTRVCWNGLILFKESNKINLSPLFLTSLWEKLSNALVLHVMHVSIIKMLAQRAVILWHPTNFPLFLFRCYNQGIPGSEGLRSQPQNVRAEDSGHITEGRPRESRLQSTKHHKVSEWTWKWQANLHKVHVVLQGRRLFTFARDWPRTADFTAR